MGKSAFASAITAGITQGAGFDGDMSKMQGGELYGTMAGKELISSTVTGVMDGQDAGEFLGSFATNFAGGFVSHKIGDLGVKYGLEDGSIPKAFLHGVASGSLSSINGGEFGIGFTSGAIGEFAGSYIDPDSKRGKGAVGLAASTGALLIGGSAKDITLAGDNAKRTFEYNRRLHGNEQKVLAVIKKGKTLEEQRRYDLAAKHMVRASVGVPENDVRKAYLASEEAAGAYYTNEQSELKALASNMGMKEAFEYTPWHSVVDYSSRNYDRAITKSTSAFKVGAGYVVATGSVGVAEFTAGFGTPIAIAGVGYGSKISADGIKEFSSPYVSKEGSAVEWSFRTNVPSYDEIKAYKALETGLYYLGGQVVGRAAPIVWKEGGMVLNKGTSYLPAKLGKSNVSTLPKPHQTNSLVQKTQKNGRIADVNVNSGPRYRPGKATGGENLQLVREGDKWMRGTHANAAKIPKQVADKMRDKEYKNFDEFRKDLYRHIENDPVLRQKFKNSDLVNMKEGGLAPVAHPSQWVGRNRSYNLHHEKPIHHGGEVYDFDNLYIVTPKFHREILDPKYHLGRSK